MSGCLERFAGLAVGQEREQKRYFREGRLYTLQIESTDACQQQCLYCYAGSTPAETRALAGSEIVGLLEDAARLGIRAIDWLGGDPLLRQDWHELALHAVRLGLINNVWTSGLPLRDREVARLAVQATRLGFVSVHLDSISPDVYCRLHRGARPENVAAIVEAVDNLIAEGKSPDQIINCITYTALQPPLDTVNTMRWWLERKGIRTCLTLFNPAGMGAAARTLVPAEADVKLVYRERDRLNFGEGDGSIGAMDTDKFYCGTMAAVTFTGEVTPCSVIREGVGNIRRTPFARIVAEHLGELTHQALHDECNLPAPCDACGDSSHCWGCRASAYHYGGDANGRDPKCWSVREVRAPRSTGIGTTTEEEGRSA